jgi:hypothetical protein
MTRIHGQILRLVGIFIEMLGILALAFWTKSGPDGAPLPGSITQRTGWAVIVGGFGVWALGNAVIYWPRGDRGKIADAESRNGDALRL